MYQSASHCHVSLTSRVLSLITCCFMMAATNSFGQYSSLVTYNTDGTLAYTTDADGNRIQKLQSPILASKHVESLRINIRGPVFIP